MLRLERDRPSMHPSVKFSPGEVLRTLMSPHVVLVFMMLVGLLPMFPNMAHPATVHDWSAALRPREF